MAHAGVFGPSVGDIEAYNHTGSIVTPFSVDVAGEDPDKIQGDFNATQYYLAPIPFVMTAAKQWVVFSTEVNPTGATLTAAQVVMFAAATSVEVGGVSIGHFLSWVTSTVGPPSKAQIRFSTFGVTHGTTTTEYNVGDTVVIRIETNGTRVKVWVDGTLEFDVADASYWSRLFLTNPSHSSYEHLWWLGAQHEGTSGADRPDASVEVGLCFPTGNYGGVNDYGGEAGGGEDCTDNTIGDQALWNDYNGGLGSTHDGAATYNCLLGGTAGKEISVMSGVAVTRTPQGVTGRSLANSNAAAKTVVTFTVVKADDGGASESEAQNVNISWNTVWRGIGRVFGNPPVGAWSDYVDPAGNFNGLAAGGSLYKLALGVRSPNTNNANDLHTAIFFEVGSLGSDPEPAVGEDRRRVPGFV